MIVHRKCSYCGKDFSRNVKGHDLHHRGKFCSRKCYYEARKAKRIEVSCENCGNKVRRLSWRVRVKPPKHIFCSSDCYHRFKFLNPNVYTKNGPGKDHYPEMTKAKLIEMYVNQGMRLKDIVKEFSCGFGTVVSRFKKYGIKTRRFHEYFQYRDNQESLTHWKFILNKEVGECQICGWNKGQCDVHHRIEKVNGGKDTKENLILICPNCHRLIHEKKLKIESDLM